MAQQTQSIDAELTKERQRDNTEETQVVQSNTGETDEVFSGQWPWKRGMRDPNRDSQEVNTDS